jgi:hypothetical protein
MSAERPSTAPRRTDLVLSVLLPAAVIGLGVALSVGGGIDGLVALCLGAIR